VTWYCLLMRFYIRKIGEHLQELAVLAVIFVPLDHHLTTRGIIYLAVGCGAILVAGIEMERRAK
jgi:hypothetical protein